MENLTHSTEGFIHLISSTVALTLGTLVLIITKGTRLHKKLGYGYLISMVVLIITAFTIYRLLGRFGPFHIAAIVSSATLLVGIIPPLFFRHKRSWIIFHFKFMYWSVIGLYAAFVSEIMVRVPAVRFWWGVGGSTFVVIGLGVYFSIRQSKKWEVQFFSKR